MRRPLTTSSSRVSCLFVVAALFIGCGSDSTDGFGRGDIKATGGAPAAGGIGGGGYGAEITGGGVPPGSGGAVACKGTAEPCTDSLECCEGSTCNNTAQAAELNGCHPRCSQNSECSTGCCLLYTGDTRGICAAAQWCSCGTAGKQCGAAFPACCGDHSCLAKDATQTSYECKKQCQQNTDCPTNCCVAIPNINVKACLDPVYCPAQ